MTLDGAIVSWIKGGRPFRQKTRVFEEGACCGVNLCVTLGLSKNTALFLTAGPVQRGAMVFLICTNLNQGSQLWIQRWAQSICRSAEPEC